MNQQFQFDDDHFHDHCGVFGVFAHPEAAKLAYLGLYALQHRGQEAAGICSSDGTDLRVAKGMGLVQDIFDPKRLASLPGDSAIGHTRYSTAGDTTLTNAQPILIDCSKGKIAIGHNGNLTDAAEWRRKLEHRGSIFQTTSDTEVIVHLIARSSARNLSAAIADALNQAEGAYSLAVLTRDELYAIRDPRGFRPLCLGRLGDSYMVASETCAFDLLDAKYIREIEPGEMLRISRAGLESIRFAPPKQHQYCIFEHVYFARPDSLVFNRSVHHSRENLGRLLARQHPVPADVVVPVPDSGVPAAIGYSLESGVPFRMGLIRNHYIGRTFIQPVQAIRDFGVKLKLNPVRGLLEGKRVVLVDDSIVRGTTSRKIVRLVREAGAKEVHVRISSPPTISPCYYGIDTPTHEELIASADSRKRPRISEADASSLPHPASNAGEADPSPRTIEEIRRFLEADSLGYLSLENLREAVSDTDRRFCTSCFTGVYPTPPVQLEVRDNSQHNNQHSQEIAHESQPTVTRES